MKRNSRIIITVLCLAVLLGVLGLALWLDSGHNDVESARNDKKACSIRLPQLGEVYLVNDAVVEWMEGEYSAKALYNALREEGRMDAPKPVVIAYSIDNIPAKLEVVSQTIVVSEREDLRDPRIISVEPDRRRVEIYNLRADMQYYYQLNVELSDGQKLSARSSFTTANTPRFVQIDGVRNCRDIGGYLTIDGKKIRDGMIYRGTELDGAISNKYFITESGANTMLNELGVVTEMDMRASSTENAKDALGDAAAHNYFSYLSYMESFTDHGKRKTREVFECMADESAYPMYFHCTYGADRTGTIIYYIEAVLGLSEEDLYREWELSAFLVGGAFEEDFANFVAELKNYDGDTMHEKVVNYLLSIGVTQETMDKIREILLCDA